MGKRDGEMEKARKEGGEGKMAGEGKRGEGKIAGESEIVKCRSFRNWHC